MKIDSNILSIFILGIIYIASVSLNIAKNLKKTNFHLIIYTIISLLLVQMAMNAMAQNPRLSLSAFLASLSFLHSAALPVLPALFALYVTKQKNPRLIKEKSAYAIYFIPMAINLMLLAGGVKNTYNVLISIAPVFYALYIVIRSWKADSSKTNVSYILFSLTSMLPIVLAKNGLILISISLLVMFLTNEITETRKDSLTGINNREYLYDYTQRLINQNRKFTVVMFDLDKLKHINDTYGHIEGDEAIVNATNIIKSKIRQKDFFARYAGDEFVLVLETSDVYNIRRLLHRIDKAFAGYNLKSEKNYTLSISSGYCVNNEDDTSIKELIERADSQMFKNKRKKFVESWQTNIELLSVIK